MTAALLGVTASCGSSGIRSPADEHCWPRMWDPEPKGMLPFGTTAVTLRLNTDRGCVCRWDDVEGLRYFEMENTFAQTGGVEHATVVAGLRAGGHRLYAKCEVPAADPQTDCSTPHDLIFVFGIAREP